jgi:hypothetical protein
MSTSFRFEPGSLTQLLSTEINSLASGSLALQNNATNPLFDNSQAGNQYFWADFELVVTFAAAPTAGTTVDIYILETLDGTNYGDGTTGLAVASHFVGSFPVRAVATAQRIMIRGIPLSPVKFQVQIYNNGTGQAFAASGNTLKMLPYREQGV